MISAVAARARTAATSEVAVAELTALAADHTDDITVVVVRRIP